MPAIEHVHTYVRYRKARKSNNGGVQALYKCDDPQCTHTGYRDLIIGRLSRCTCGNDFVLTADALRLSKPKCLDCRDTKEAKEYRAAKSVMDLILNSQHDVAN